LALLDAHSEIAQAKAKPDRRPVARCRDWCLVRAGADACDQALFNFPLRAGPAALPLTGTILARGYAGAGGRLNRIGIAILLALAALPAWATGMRTSLRVGAVVFRSCNVALRPDGSLFACTRPGDTTPKVTTTPRDARDASERGYQFIEVNF
jgi:hypothetical protein